MHQDWAFYQHADGRYVDCLIHLDDTDDTNGCIRFLDGSHRAGARDHVTKNPDGSPCTPHLPTDDWDIEDTVPVPAKRGDVVAFSIHMIHGSRINRTDAVRRIVRVGYRDPEKRPDRRAVPRQARPDRLGPATSRRGAVDARHERVDL